jgi:LSD1 subclass zinc finger protein
MAFRTGYDDAVKKKTIGQILRPYCRQHGICVHCFRRWAEHGARCQWCYRADLAFQRRRYERRKKAGICRKCGKYPQQETNVRCADCQEEHYARKVRTRATNRKASRKTSKPVRKARIDAQRR